MVAPMSHPVLPAGYNADDNNGDEVDGAGTNWAIWPLLYDTFETKYVLIVSEEMLGLFGTICADYTVPATPNVITFPAQNQEVQVRNVWSEQVLAPASNTITLPAEQWAITVRRKA